MKNLFAFPLLLLWIFCSTFGISYGGMEKFTSRARSVIESVEQQMAQNFKDEFAEAITKEEQQGVVRKYAILGDVFAAQRESLWESPQHGLGGLREKTEAAAPALAPAADSDIAARLTASYHPKALGAVKKVFADFGDLYVNLTKDVQGEVSYQDFRVDRPWSGYWYPFYDRSLYEGDSSPLRKFDRVLAALGFVDSNIALSEQAKYSGFHPDSWEGFCDGWSISSMLLKEPSDVLTVAEVKFSIADQKALAVFAHIGYPYTTYGLKYTGDAASDGTFQDIYPEAFHRLVTKVLGEEKIPLIIDETPGVQVWNKPIYRYRWKIEQDLQKDYAFVVTAYPWLVKERWQANDIPTSMNDVIAPLYRYRLFVDKKIQRDGLYKVVAGEWIEDSFENHPGSVKYVKIGQQPRSANEIFNKYIEVYKKYFYRP